ncbi:MAG: aspartate kinase [Deferribacteraceae bacterium]|jgi:aspartate kinase|nr:aspartate kinase [Deferribacteraceae bacterium]
MLVVVKFGGTSVANVERIKNAAQKTAAKKASGYDVVVVSSAMAGITDQLISYLREISKGYSLREYDQLVSTGETANIPLITQALIELGYEAESLTGAQAGIYTDSNHSKARITSINTERIRKVLSEGKICVVAGFQGISSISGNVTTLGRGGSDTTAVALAAVLKADLCEIYTDVDGVYTADPRLVRDAKKLSVISHEEMLELASLGAKVLMPRCVEFGMNYNVDIMVLSSLEDKPGTLVTSKELNSGDLRQRGVYVEEKIENMEKMVIKGVTSDKNQAKITLRELPDRPGIAADIFSRLTKANVNVDMIIQNIAKDGRANLSFTVPKTELNTALTAVNTLIAEIPEISAEADEDIAKVSIVGVGMLSHVGVASTMFQTLSKHGINILMISTSEIKISCVIDEKFTELAVRVLHDVFISGAIG